MDQAHTLRKWAAAPGGATTRALAVVAVTSGKGGVGKTNVVANLAVALADLGRRVLVLDADLGLGNVDVLLGLSSRDTVEDVFDGRKTLAEVVTDGPRGVRILPAGSGWTGPRDPSSAQIHALLDQIERTDDGPDVVLIDTGAGISSNVLAFNAAARAIVVVATPDPASLTDAYALMKVLRARHGEHRFSLVVNMARSEHEAHETARTLREVAGRFLGVTVEYLGAIPDDAALRKAVGRQRAVVDVSPHAPSSLAFLSLAHRVASWDGTVEMRPIEPGPAR
ncbi:MAG: MinD/ParA family protein [Nitrospirota bacterium]